VQALAQVLLDAKSQVGQCSACFHLSVISLPHSLQQRLNRALF
jgi:recombinational DNA repair protein RecR